MAKNVKHAHMRLYWLALSIVAASMAMGESKMVDYPIHVKDLHIRDPFVLPIVQEKTYYMYASGRAEGGYGCKAYMSKDLEHWSNPVTVFDPPAEYKDCNAYWAPEVHEYKGKFYLFMTLKAPRKYRGTHIFVAEKPTGPFVPTSKTAATPAHWECLDGTLFVSDEGRPYIVFCHEWCQVRNGGMCALPLTDDLSAAAGSPIYLFSASDAPWAPKKEIGADGSFPTYVTDGPFMYRGKDNRLFMLWSSFGPGDYTVGLAESKNGRIDGEWFQHEKPVYENGGHCMLFKDFDGQLRMSLHGPNRGPLERAHFLRLVETEDGLLKVVP